MVMGCVLLGLFRHRLSPHLRNSSRTARVLFQLSNPRYYYTQSDRMTDRMNYNSVAYTSASARLGWYSVFKVRVRY